MRKKELSIPTLAGVIVAVAGLISGIWLVQRQFNSKIQADSETTPKQVKISNLGDTSFTVSWTTAQAASGFIQYANANQEPDLVMSDDRDQVKGSIDKYFTHAVTIKGLTANTAYGFKIGSDKVLHDFQGQTYRVTTGPTLTNPPAADVAYGKVTYSSGDPAEGALVFVQLPGGTLQSGIVKASGSWAVPLSGVRKADLTDYLNYDKVAETVDISVSAGPSGEQTLKITTANDSPTPNIIIGASNENIPTAGVTVSPTAAVSLSPTIVLPLPTAAESKLGSEEIKLLTPRQEMVSANSGVEIKGVAPAGTEISIEIHSDNQISATTVADEFGTFTYQIPDGLTPGEHSVTITAMVNGVKKQITRSFTVYAAETTPKFTATPSATITVIPSATSIPTKAPTPTAIRIPTVSPTAGLPTAIPTLDLNPATESGLKVAGTWEITLISLAAALGLIVMGGAWYITEAKVENKH